MQSLDLSQVGATPLSPIYAFILFNIGKTEGNTLMSIKIGNSFSLTPLLIKRAKWKMQFEFRGFARDCGIDRKRIVGYVVICHITMPKV